MNPIATKHNPNSHAEQQMSDQQTIVHGHKTHLLDMIEAISTISGFPLLTQQLWTPGQPPGEYPDRVSFSLGEPDFVCIRPANGTELVVWLNGLLDQLKIGIDSAQTAINAIDVNDYRFTTFPRK